jgi:DNA primase
VTELARSDLGDAGSTMKFHPWTSRMADTERPSEWRIDLDPGPVGEFGTVRRVARLVREIQGSVRRPALPLLR